MCGIAGFINSSFSSHEYPVFIENMLAAIAYRGPDERGYYFDESVALGTVRLSVIDVASGQQPITDPSQRYWICYNGEIYNYKELKTELQNLGYQFSTDSDTEVALYAWIAWGTDAFARLNGGFAFAIYDRLENSIVLVRDRYGKRPLYYFYEPLTKTLVFASEIKCFLAYPAIKFSFDVDKLASIFTLWTPLAAETAFTDIKQVPMGAYLRFKNKTIEIKEYKPLDFSVAPFCGSETEAIQVVREKLTESVKLRLRSDVPVGTYLSGGLDSAIVTQLAIEQGVKSLCSFSVSFEDQVYDESSKQSLLSQHWGIEHHSLRVSNEDIAQAFPEAVWHAETPLFRTALVPMLLLSQKVNQHGIKVVLTGEGADESFLGYEIFKETALRQLLKHDTGVAQQNAIIDNLYPYLNHYKEGNHRSLMGLYQQFLEEKTPGLYSHEIRYHNSQFALRMLKAEKNNLQGIQEAVQEANGCYQHFNAHQKAQWLEFKTLLAGYLLSSQGDRMSLANGVENRCPFLDFNIVEYAASLPDHFKLRDGVNEKYILKQAFKNVLPTAILTQPKQPYRAPDAGAFLGNGRKQDYLELILSEHELRKLGFIDADFCQKFTKKVTNTPADKISPRENQAFIQLLSLALLNQFYIQRKNLPTKMSQANPVLMRAIDGRTRHGAI
jgi:asparagine synthase (glutamine-hydrolysing)